VDSAIHDWLTLLGRWVHIIAGIAWIGTSFFFNWLDSSFDPPREPKKGVDGELWMVHSGGFYQVEKRRLGPNEVPDKLHWFKWEAMLTLISGMFLFGIIFYLGDGLFLIESEGAPVGVNAAIAISVLSFIVSWFFYDLLWASKLGEKSNLCSIITFIYLCVATYVLTFYLSGRASYMNVGGIIGVMMVMNVWVRIIPAQKNMIAATKAGETPDYNLGRKAKQRSKHNNYFTLPVIFIMISNHFPDTYGHKYNWIILIVLSIAGAAFRHWMNLKEKQSNQNTAPLWALIIASLVVFVYLTKPQSHSHDEVVSNQEVSESKEVSRPVEQKAMEEKASESTNKVLLATSSQDIVGVIEFKAEVPKAKKLRLPKACAKKFKGDVYSDKILVKDQKLQNVIVYISKGLEGKTFPKASSEEVLVDQKGCIYVPRIITARVGQKVTFINSDKIFHNVRTRSKNNGSFNINMPKINMRKTKVFKKAEIAVHAKCNLHPWMGARIGVFDHPYYTISNEKGEFRIKNLPPGNYTLEAWHEVYGKKIKEITLTVKSSLETKFDFTPEK
jgi:uncharacterized membrane protein/plastocyanin